MKYTQSMSFADIEKAIPTLAKRGASFRADIHSVLVSIGRQWKASGNVAHAAKLFSRIIVEVEGYYGQAILNYVEGIYGMKWDQKAKALVYSVTTVSDEALKQAIQEPFYEFSPPKEVKSQDFNALLMALLDKNNKAAAPEVHAKREANGVEDKLIPLDKVRAIKAILAQAA
jgi:hypothetical protein